MRYATFERDSKVSWGVVQAGGVLDLPAAAAAAGLTDWPETLLAFIQAGPVWWERAGQLAAAAGSASLLPLSGLRLLAPVPQPLRNVFALGLNYAEHAAEGGHNAPDAPIYFTKATTAVIGPDEPIIADPSVSQKLDWEVELGVILGTGGRRISEADALDHVFGYTVIHDVSARDLQFARSGQWFLGKSFDTGCPMGPWIVSADEIGDPQNLDLCLRVNGVEKQSSNTRYMIFPVAKILADLSSVLTLQAGDIISTGTPSGIGGSREPPEYLQPGDVTEAEVSGIGLLRNPVLAPSP
jgi:2-keto-4-pentenoate hydratase/2-oxohepta-3-ene-1,7-dioic acid hydratase in catechol pathway